MTGIKFSQDTRMVPAEPQNKILVAMLLHSLSDLLPTPENTENGWGRTMSSLGFTGIAKVLGEIIPMAEVLNQSVMPDTLKGKYLRVMTLCQDMKHSEHLYFSNNTSRGNDAKPLTLEGADLSDRLPKGFSAEITESGHLVFYVENVKKDGNKENRVEISVEYLRNTPEREAFLSGAKRIIEDIKSVSYSRQGLINFNFGEMSDR